MKIRTIALTGFGLLAGGLMAGCSLQEAASMLLISESSSPVSNYAIAEAAPAAKPVVKYLQVSEDGGDLAAGQGEVPSDILNAIRQAESAGGGQPRRMPSPQSGMGDGGRMPRRMMRPVAEGGGGGQYCPRCPQMNGFANSVAYSLVQEIAPGYQPVSMVSYVEVTNLGLEAVGDDTAYIPNEGMGEPVFLKTQNPGSEVAIFDAPDGNPLTIQDSIKGELPVKAFDRQRVTVLETQGNWHLVDAGSYQGWVQGV